MSTIAPFFFASWDSRHAIARVGMLIRAGVDDREMLAASGVRVQLIFVGVFAFGAGLAGVAGPAGKVSFTWTNPQPKPGDSYKWRVHSLTADGPFQAAAAPRAQVAAGRNGPSCIQVMIVRSDGASSPLGPDSIACVPK